MRSGSINAIFWHKQKIYHRSYGPQIPHQKWAKYTGFVCFQTVENIQSTTIGHDI